MGRPSLFGPAPVFDGAPPALDRRLRGALGVAAALQLALLVLLGSLLVFEIRGQRYFAVSDDIYISACYARNLAAGLGAVWYPGAQPVEGFSNPLWTALLVGVHRLPWFREADLGLYVLALEVLSLAAVSVLSLRVLRRLLAVAGGPVDLGTGRLAAVVVVSLGASSLAFWLSQGFEIGLVLALALGALAIALRPRAGAGAALAIGSLAGLSLWARMDGPLYAAAAFLLLLRSPGGVRKVAAAALVLAGFAATLFLARRAVFGEWLPNTYWLKLSGWPLADRVRAGIARNAPLLPALGAAWLGLASPGVRRSLGAAAVPAAALLATSTLAVLYSIHNGGDSWNLRLGYDRFSAPGAVLLVLALALALLRAGGSPLRRGAVASVAAAIALSPAALDPSFAYLVRLAAGKFVPTERTYVDYGLALEECSRPGARILTGAAGAIVYFSHRAGSDFLGKCDPWVARQPVNTPRMTSGHNKRYAPEVFRRDRPEFSRERPPPDLEGEYEERSMRGNRVWVRRDAEHVVRERLDPP